LHRSNLLACRDQAGRFSGARNLLFQPVPVSGRNVCRAPVAAPPGSKSCTLRTNAVANWTAVSALRNCRKRRLLFSRERSVTSPGRSCQALFFQGARECRNPVAEKNVFYHEKRLAMGIPVSTMRLESRSYYEHDDRAETLFGCPSHSVGIGALRDCGEFQRALSSADNQ